MPKPAFTKDYVINLTKRNMEEAVKKSIEKTVARIGEFEPDTKEAREVIETIATLQGIKNQLAKI
jgi:hypothetical protein